MNPMKSRIETQKGNYRATLMEWDKQVRGMIISF
jgi:hypothetical protein